MNWTKRNEELADEDERDSQKQVEAIGSPRPTVASLKAFERPTQPARNVVILPAGAMLMRSVKQPDYVARSPVNAKKKFKDANITSFDEFVSISQMEYPIPPLAEDGAWGGVADSIKEAETDEE